MPTALDNRLYNFPTIFEKGYRIGLAEDIEDVVHAMRLRASVFNAVCPSCVELEHDDFDSDSDHLLVWSEQPERRVVGNYRLRSNRRTSKFYCSTEFGIGKLLDSLGPAGCLEVSRACVLPESRSRKVLDFLIRGMLRYAAATRSRYIFGALSVPMANVHHIERLMQYFMVRPSRLKSLVELGPESAYKIAALTEDFDRDDLERAESAMPPMMRIFKRAGAEFYPTPYVDNTFGCVDFFGLLDLKSMSSAYTTIYGHLVTEDGTQA